MAPSLMVPRKSMSCLFHSNLLTLLIFASVLSSAKGWAEEKEQIWFVPTDGNPDENRIVGGTPVTSRDTYPFFSVTDPLGCGGFLVAPDIVISAAHCRTAFTPGRLIHIGGTQLDGSNARDSVTVAETVVHPDYVNPLVGDDVLIARLSRESTVNQFAQINADDALPLDTDDVVAIGHGTTSSGGAVSSLLLEVTVPIVDADTCRTDPRYDDALNEERMLCAGAEGIDSCQGDSGGTYSALSAIVRAHLAFSRF